MEKPPTNNRERPKSQEEEDNERLEAFIKMHPELFPDPDAPKELRECGPGISELEEMFRDFKEKFNLEDLHAIVHLKFEDAKNHPLREPARLALAPIFKKLKEIKEQTNITDEQYKKLEDQRQELSRAVGIINNNIVDHTRGL